MKAYTEVNKVNESARQKAQNKGEDIYQYSYIEYADGCVKCGERIRNDSGHTGIGQRYACGCSSWRWDWVKRKLVRVV